MTIVNTKRKRRVKPTMWARMAAVGLKPEVRETMLAHGLSQRFVDLTLENVVAGREFLAKSLRDSGASEHMIKTIVFDEPSLLDNSRGVAGNESGSERVSRVSRRPTRARVETKRIAPRPDTAGTVLLKTGEN